MDAPTPSPATDRLLEIIATIVVAVGGTIGGALIALKRALKPVEREVVPKSANGHSRLETQIIEGHARLETKLMETEARITAKVSDIDKRLVEVETLVDVLREGWRDKSHDWNKPS